MLNQIIQKIIDSKNTSNKAMDIVFNRPIGQYLDMFTDNASLDNYIIANNGLDIDSNECVKFSQIYKNNLEDIDESNMVDGNVYGRLSNNIRNTFGNKTNVLVADSPSIVVKRIKNSTNHDDDVFTYNVLMDAHIMQNKEWMKSRLTQTAYD